MSRAVEPSGYERLCSTQERSCASNFAASFGEQALWDRRRQIAEIVGIEFGEDGEQALGGGAFDQRLTNRLTRFHQRRRGERRFQLAPHQDAIVWRNRLEDTRDVGRMEGPQRHFELDEVLPALHLLEEPAPRRLLPPRHVLEQAMLGEQALDFLNLLLEPIGRCSFHDRSA